jgi:hypothetical protein
LRGKYAVYIFTFCFGLILSKYLKKYTAKGEKRGTVIATIPVYCLPLKKSLQLVGIIDQNPLASWSDLLAISASPVTVLPGNIVVDGLGVKVLKVGKEGVSSSSPPVCETRAGFK